MKYILRYLLIISTTCSSAVISYAQQQAAPQLDAIRKGFLEPPNTAKPGVYWYFMDGNMSAETMTKDLESMQRAGIGNVIFLEVNVGIPLGPVDFFSEQWQDLFAHAVHEGERLGIEITLGIGPGWTGSGGPWVSAAQSMKHLVSSSTVVHAGSKQQIMLSVPPPKTPYFGEGVFSPELKTQWNAYYEDVAVLAFPTPSPGDTIAAIDERALFYRDPYSSVPNVKTFIPALPASARNTNRWIEKKQIIDLTDKMQPDGTLNWSPPAGSWTVMRFVSRNNGAITRPAPVAGLGFESDKFDTVALDAHQENYVGTLLRKVGQRDTAAVGGLKRLHIDSWEMGAQNWTANFRAEFKKRRGYDPLTFYPVYDGRIVDNPAISERFLWDLRQTAQELVLAYHAERVKKYAHQHQLQLSIEPYDMNPTADLELGAVADLVMCEFWSKGFGYNTSFSCIEATSVAHVNGQAVVPAEAFTAEGEDWRQYPGSMKNQGDWAFASGINRFTFHTFQNQALADSLRPGMTMGGIGVHWDRGQTWWPMVGDYHRYITRSQYLLQQGRTVADILYLSPEGSPQVFRAPASALTGDAWLPDRKGYNFDGCSPGQLDRASVQNGQIVFPGGASYRMLVLPELHTMTPALLKKILTLVKSGATVVGMPPAAAPGLTNYPACDEEIRRLSIKGWGSRNSPGVITYRNVGKGKIIWGGALTKHADPLYPDYETTAQILRAMQVPEDFTPDQEIRFTHRTAPGWDIYFVSNSKDQPVVATASFRTTNGDPWLWNAVTGEMRRLPQYEVRGQQTSIPLTLDAYESAFIVFSGTKSKPSSAKNFPDVRTVTELQGAWNVSFDPKWGGPAEIQFDQLSDWSRRPEDGIKYYSGTAVYRKNFDLPESAGKARFYLDLGEVKNMARVKLNGKDLGVVWTAPWRVDISEVVQKNNQVEIEVVNLWPNRLIGDERLPDDGIKNGQWPDWLLQGKPRPGRRYTFTTHHPYAKDSPLLPSGLIGPVRIMKE